MSALVEEISKGELLALVEDRREQVGDFIEWADGQERGGSSMYLANRPDIRDAREAATLYPKAWWGVVVFTCFGSLNSARATRDVLPEPVDADIADELLASVTFTRPMVGYHRIQQGLVGAKRALVAACEQAVLLHDVLHAESLGFDERYCRLRSARLARWGRTTCFDLLLRAGALGLGGQNYEPEIAYLAGSTGPRAGFRAVWGHDVTDQTAPWCEGLLQAWHEHWAEVVDQVGAPWQGRPYAPGDLENALCIYQERRPSRTPGLVVDTRRVDAVADPGLC